MCMYLNIGKIEERMAVHVLDIADGLVVPHHGRRTTRNAPAHRRRQRIPHAACIARPGHHPLAQKLSLPWLSRTRPLSRARTCAVRRRRRRRHTPFHPPNGCAAPPNVRGPRWAAPPHLVRAHLARQNTARPRRMPWAPCMPRAMHARDAERRLWSRPPWPAGNNHNYNTCDCFARTVFSLAHFVCSSGWVCWFFVFQIMFNTASNLKVVERRYLFSVLLFFLELFIPFKRSSGHFVVRTLGMPPLHADSLEYICFPSTCFV